MSRTGPGTKSGCVCFLVKMFKIMLSICSWERTQFLSKLCMSYIIGIDKNPAILLIFRHSGHNSHFF